MTTVATARRSFWGWGLESEEPSAVDREKAARALGERWGLELEPTPPPRLEEIQMRAPRIKAPAALAAICSDDKHERAAHTHGKGFCDLLRAYRGDFANPPDLVARPREESDVTALLEWCSDSGYAAIPYGGGSSVVSGLATPEGSRGAVSIDLAALNRVLEVDATSRAARIQAGALGPALEAQLRPHGLTLRHFPQSFEWSSLGGWIATRSGGHFATNHTHIDDLVESVRMITPRGPWESRRLPGSGAGPSPDRLAIGSEGILGVITEAWMRVQARPRFRASAGVLFDSFMAGSEGARAVVQAKLWPANLRLLDPGEAAAAAGLDGKHALLIIGFESGEVPQEANIRTAVGLAREAGGRVDDAEIRVADAEAAEAGRQGAVGEWRNSFVRAPYNRNSTVGLTIVGDTFETSITWERWPAFDARIREVVGQAIRDTGGRGTLTCRFTHVYTDGPAPYYSFSFPGRKGAEIEMWTAVKKAASDAVMAAGGTITHHHAVGRDHRPWYDQQRPEPFAQALRAAKRAVDPNAIMNPGVLIDP